MDNEDLRILFDAQLLELATGTCPQGRGKRFLQILIPYVLTDNSNEIVETENMVKENGSIVETKEIEHIVETENVTTTTKNNE